MIDTHCHLLNSVDDGSQSKEATLAMLNDAQKYGITKIIATPHCWPGIKYPNDFTRVNKAYQQALEIIVQHHMDIQLYFGCELFTTPDTMNWIIEKKALTMNDTNIYLVELPWSIHRDKSINETKILTEITNLGYQIVIAHPERYDIVKENLDILKTWRDLGCSFQVNRTSLLNPNGWEYETAWKIVNSGYVDVIATDAHHYTGSRIMRLDDIYEVIKTKFNEDIANLVLIDNPQRIIDGQTLTHIK